MNNFKDWYSDVAVELKKNLESQQSSNINGVEFLRDFIKHNKVEGFEYDDSEFSEDSLNDLVEQNIQLFQDYLIQKHDDWFKTNRAYIWESQSPSGEENETFQATSKDIFLDALDVNEKAIYNKTLSKIEGDDYKDCLSILKKARDNAVEIEVLSECHKMTIHAYKRTRNPTHANEFKLINNFADSLHEAGLDNSVDEYCKAAEVASRGGYKLQAAKIFKTASDSAEKYNIEPKKRQEFLRRSRLYYEAVGDSEVAASLFKEEKDLYIQSNHFFNTLGLRAFAIISNYGESPWKVARIAFISMFIFAMVYGFTGINIPSSNPSGTEVMKFTSSEDLWDSFLTSFYFSIVTFTTLGYGDLSPSQEGFSRFIAGLEALWGLFITSLFLTSVIRKYSRN